MVARTSVGPGFPRTSSGLGGDLAWAGLRSPARFAFFAVIAAAVMLGGTAHAQVPNQVVGGTMQGMRQTVPTDAYFLVLNEYYAGNYVGALADFQNCLRGGIKTTTSTWIDSICYHTMCGECLYQLGQYDAALTHYDNAIRLQTAFDGWMIPVKFNVAITPAAQGSIRPLPWGQTQRTQLLVGSFPDSVLIQQGQVDQTAKLASGGGVIQQAQMTPINPQEIVRCVCLSLRRRKEILGPLAQYDVLVGNLIASLSKRMVQPNHWSESWVDVMLGSAFAVVGKDTQAKPLLDRAIVAQGQYDHPLTATALIELGKLALNAGDNDSAIKYFQEASYSAFYFLDLITVEDALRLAATTHITANKQGPYAPLAAAVNWARLQGFRHMQVSLMTLIAEQQCVADQVPAASTTMDNIRATVVRSDIMKSRVGAQVNRMQALVNYQLGNVAGGDTAINAALFFSRTGSLSLFRMGLADQLYVRRTLTARGASEVLGELLRDPGPEQWLKDPLDALATLVFPHPLYFERWFEVSLERKELDGKRALDIVDLMKRHKYLSTQELGGRLLALRWLLEGPAETLSKTATLQRQAFLTQFPQYEKLSQQARTIRAELGQLPVVAEDPAAAKQQSAKMADLDKANRALEVMLKAMALQRMPSEIVFPPVRTTEETQKALPDRHALLTFFVGARSTFGFLMTNDKYGYWPIPSPGDVQKRLTAVLQGMGNYDENKILHQTDLAGTSWQRPSQELFDQLTQDSKASLPYGFDELIIVPDAGLWYVPFEALYVSSQGKPPKPLLEQIRIRYAPTMGLAVGDVRPRLDKGKALVSLGKLYPGDDDSVAENAYAEFARAVPQSQSFRVKQKLQFSPALFAGLADRLITFAEIVPSPNGPLGTAPLTGDKNSVGGTLDDWLRLPWQGPEQIALPGFHTAAENSLKKTTPADAGNDLFLPVMNLMASGARTVLISRWRPGGRTAFDLVREFMQELPYVSASKSWQRAVALTMNSQIALDAEPRIKLESTDAPPEAKHPFFWAAYMIVDTGTEPFVDPAEAAKQVIKVVPAQAAPPGAKPADPPMPIVPALPGEPAKPVGAAVPVAAPQAPNGAKPPPTTPKPAALKKPAAARAAKP